MTTSCCFLASVYIYHCLPSLKVSPIPRICKCYAQKQMLFTPFCSKCPLSKNYWREVSRSCHGCQCQQWGHGTLGTIPSPDTLAPPWAPKWPSCMLGEWLPHHADTQTPRQRLPIHQGLQPQSSKWPLPSSVFFHCCLNHHYRSQSNRNRWECQCPHQSQAGNP